MEEKKVLHAVKKEEEKGAEKPKTEITKLAMVVSDSDFAELLPLTPERVKALRIMDPRHEGTEPESIVFHTDIKSVKQEMFLEAHKMAGVAQTLLIAFHGMRDADGDMLFDQREMMGLHNTLDVVIEMAKKLQLLVNSYWMYLAEKRGYLG